MAQNFAIYPKKIEDDPEQPRAIRTVRGAGYMFVPQAAL